MIDGLEGAALYQAAAEFSGGGYEASEPLSFLLFCAAIGLSLLTRTDG